MMRAMEAWKFKQKILDRERERESRGEKIEAGDASGLDLAKIWDIGKRIFGLPDVLTDLLKLYPASFFSYVAKMVYFFLHYRWFGESNLSFL